MRPGLHNDTGYDAVLGTLKKLAVNVLERHPYGYATGLAIMESSSAFLPHEVDFLGMPLLSTAATGLFLDVGANRGHSALGFKKVMPGWITLSIEANPIHEARLSALKARHDFFDYRIAAADRTSGEAVTIWTPRYGGIYCHSAAALNKADAEQGIVMSFPRQASHFAYVENTTSTLRLDDLDIAPAIVKMDIQGKELDALHGLERTIEQHRPAFLIECNLKDADVMAFMSDHDYQPAIYDAHAHAMRPVEAVDIRISRNVFFTPKERGPQ